MISKNAGVDPAGPSYAVFIDKDKMLDKTDAEFVDVMHCSLGKQGIAVESGHADFYPNGGASQPDCPKPVNDVRG